MTAHPLAHVLGALAVVAFCLLFWLADRDGDL